MSRLQEPQRTFLQFGNPFRTLFPKYSCLPPKLLALLNEFEVMLTERLKKLKPADKDDILSMSWMRCAMESLNGVHSDVKNLIMALEHPVCDWDAEWIDVYLTNSVKLLDVCTAFSSEISRLRQGHLYLRCVLHYLNNSSPNQFVRANASLEGWSQHRASKNRRLDNCFSILDSLVQILDLPKVKNSAKGKVLMQAMYGVKVITLYICSIFAVAFSGCGEKLMDLQVPETCLWAETFTEIQSFIHSELKKGVHLIGKLEAMKELGAVDLCAKNLNLLVHGGLDPTKREYLKTSRNSLERSIEEFSCGLDQLAEEIDNFFHIVLKGRDELLCNLRIGGKMSDQYFARNIAKDQVVR